MTTLDTANELLRRGLYLFPLPHGNKKPKGRWTKTTSSNPAKIAAWAADEYEPPNIGINTGDSGLVVLDIDCKHGKDGFVLLEELESKHGQLPDTYTVRTPTGGLHFYFRRPDDDMAYRNRADIYRPGSGVDIRASGGFVVGPGSRTPDGEYTLESEADFAPLPEWLRQQLAEPRRDRETLADPAPNIDAVWSLVEQLPNDNLDYEAWKMRGGMIYNACGGDPEWQTIFERWSEKSNKHEATEFALSISEIEGTPYDLGWSALRSVAPPAQTRISDRLAARLAREEAAPQPEPEPLPEVVEGLPDGVAWISDLELTPPDWLVGGMLETSSLAVLYGDSNAGKTFVAMDLGLSIARHVEYAGRATQGGGVFYLAGEGARGIARRAHGWAKARGVDLASPVGGAKATPFFRHGATALDNEKEFEALIDRIAQTVIASGVPVRLIVVDTLARNFGGNENATDEMGLFVKRCDTLKELFDATVLIVHHTAKGAPGTGRGSNALRAAADTEIRVTAEEGDLVRVSCSKQKEDEAFGGMDFVLRSVALDEDELDTTAALDFVPWDVALGELFVQPDAVALLPIARALLLYGANASAPKVELAEALPDPEDAGRLLRFARRHEILVPAKNRSWKAGRNFGLYATIHELLTGDDHQEAESVMRRIPRLQKAKIDRLAALMQEDGFE